MRSREPQHHDHPIRSGSERDHERSQLIGLAYRLLRSLSEAEDPVQETYARWYAIRSPGTWLTRI
ncbi:sigma factor [Nonomuraea sp. NPDC000554]|uniref:sigma factor n=1 Tax=Nonomuraea sp. NPDC000554 TaxID=3154259 RepID=UPI00331E8704